MGIVINQTYARIGIERTPSSLDIQKQDAKLELHQKHAKLNIRTELPRIEIDQYECFASAGRKGSMDLAREMAQMGYQAAMQYIAKTSSDGDTLAAIENGGNPLVNIVLRDAYPEHEFGMDTIPKARPKITVKGSIEFDAERNSEGTSNGVEINYKPGSLNFSFTPAQIRIYMEQYNSISMKYQENKVNAYA